MHASDCPSNEILQALLLGQLPDDESGQYESHIVGCEACGVRTRQIQASDPLLDLLPAVTKVTWSAAEEEESRQMLERFADRSKLLASTAHGGAMILTGQIEPQEGKTAEGTSTHSSISSSEPTVIPVTRLASGSSESSHHTLVLQPAEGVTLGAYRLDKKLGQGGMGTVWKAFHTRLKKPVALKVLSAHLLRDAALVARFEREMEAVGKLDHPAIVRAMDAGEIEGTHYLVMEYVEGTDFGQLVKMKGARTVRDACEMVRQAAVGLAYAHKNGLVHRDIKPSNLFLTKDGKVKVLDLGLARLQGEGLAADPGAELTSTGQILGTPDYMAPEQWENTHTAGPACDLYALGCTLFFLLTGRPPFADEKHASLPKKMLGHCEHVPPPLSAIRAGLLAKVRKSNPTPTLPDAPRQPPHDIPPELEAIYEKLMAKEPAARFATTDQLAAALVEIIKAKAPVPAPPAPAPADVPVPPKAEAALPSPPAPAETLDPALDLTAGDPPFRRVRNWLIGFGGLAAALLFGVIIITIKNKDGSTTKLEVDDAAEVTVSRKGDAGKPTPAPQPSTLNAQPVSWHGWPADAPKPAIAPFDAGQAKKHQEEWAAYLKVPVEYTNSIGMKFRLIPPGQFLMGTDPDEIERLAALARSGNQKQEELLIRTEGPQHRVTLPQPVYVGMHEVSQAAFDQIMGQNPSHFPVKPGDAAGPDVRSNPPVESVTWTECVEFCQKLAAKEFREQPQAGKKPPTPYRIPTEAEWEFACRAGTTSRFSSGDSDKNLAEAGWSRNTSGDHPHAGGLKQANGFGLFDMHGNVWEWCRDGVDLVGYGRSAAVDPLNEPVETSNRMARGGGYGNSSVFSRSAVRNSLPDSSRFPFVGFRVTLRVDAVRQASESTKANTTPLAVGWHSWPANAPKPAIAPFDAAQAKKHQEEWAAYLKVPVEYTDELGLTYRLMPPGTFTMGLPTKEYDRIKAAYDPGKEGHRLLFLNSEMPARSITLTRPFYLATTEVNYGQLSHYVELSGAVTDAERDGWGLLTGPADKLQRFEQGFSWRRMAKAREQGAGFLSWNDCDAMIAFLSTHFGLEYRFPSEAEWEYACRAGTETLFSVGDTLAKEQAAIDMNVQPVGSFPPNGFGLRDMHGSVQEYVDDDWELPPGSALSNIDPRRPTVSVYRIIRGGTATDPAISNRSSIRQPFVANGRTRMNGIRLSLTLESVRRKLGDSSVPQASIATAASWHGWPADAPKPAIAPFDAAQAKQHQEEWAAYLKVPVEYTNSIGMKFRLIPPGEFKMGATPAEIELTTRGLVNQDDPHKVTLASSEPVHKVVLTQPFYVGIHEVTQGEFEAVTGNNPSMFSNSTTRPEYIERVAKDFPDLKAHLKEAAEAVAGQDTAGHPVESLLWTAATEFLSKLSIKERTNASYDARGVRLKDAAYRLPTEAEWEFACRAGTTTRYWKGDQEADLTQHEWTAGSTNRTEPVGRRTANPFGLHDMLGNVRELIEDDWDADYFRSVSGRPAVNPRGPQKGDSPGLARGGDWTYGPPFCLCSSRYVTNRASFARTTGFRAVLTVDTVRQQMKPVKGDTTPSAGGWPADAPKPAIAPFDAAQAKRHQEEWAAYLKVPVEYTNSIGMKFRLIPPGEFLMGSGEKEIAEALAAIHPSDTPWVNGFQSEAPRHSVTLTQPFFFCETETTQSQFHLITERNPSQFAPEGAAKKAVAGLDTGNFPVEMVMWADGADFCSRLSLREQLTPLYGRSEGQATRLDGVGYRLPTEAEWEFACRGGTTTSFWTGDQVDQLPAVAWTRATANGRPHEVGALQPNPFGLFDVHGNVWEWVEDGWETRYQSPADGASSVNPLVPYSPGQKRVMRGGDWFFDPIIASSSRRYADQPTRPGFNLGFRPVLSVAAVQKMTAPREGTAKPGDPQTVSGPASPPID